jgi:D-alanyl-lipoteichoic acid acyltransferase DltB (MBOAT superfamily)
MQIKAIAQISQNSPIPVKLQCGFTLAIAYPLFLYANFSGYIDIVIALARLMRIRLPENFNHPFAASSFLDFWNRWHITLSTWLKNYVYNPLLLASMRRIGAVSMQSILGVFCFFFTFSLVGIWHGRSSEFVFFGILQGGGVSVNKLWQLELTRRFGRPGYKALAQKPVYVALGRGLTFSWFTFTLLWFWGSWPQIILMFTALGALHWLALWLIIWLSATLALTAWEWLRARLSEIMTGSEPVLTSLGARLIYITVLVATVFVFSVMRSHTAPGLVYKGF